LIKILYKEDSNREFI